MDLNSAGLHAIRGRNTFCGPAAIASVLGVDTDHAARVLRKATGERRITGVHTRDLQEALRTLGAMTRLIYLGEPYESLADWLRLASSRIRASHAILAFGAGKAWHYGVVSEGLYQCSLTRKPVEFDAIPFRPINGVVESAILVLTRPPSVPQDPVRESRRLLGRAETIAARNGIVIKRILGVDVRRPEFDVRCPELEHDDPLDDRGPTDDAAEVLRRVQLYQECLDGGYLEAVTDPRML